MCCGVRTAPLGRVRGHRARAVVAHLESHRRAGPGEVDPRLASAAVTHDVGGRFAHHPGQELVDVRRQGRIACDHDGHVDAGGFEHLAGAGELGVERAHPVAGHGFAHLLERAPRDLLEVVDLVASLVVLATLEAATGELGLEHYHRQAVAQQVVQVAGKAQALLGDRVGRRQASHLVP